MAISVLHSGRDPTAYTDHLTPPVVVLDDGVQTTNPDLNKPLTVADANQLATDHAPGADLDGVAVTIKGVGQIAGDPAPAGGDWVPAVQAFAQQTCDATDADCTILTATN